MNETKYGVVLTLDYEVQGNGSGSIDDLVIAPTEKLLEVCDSEGAKLTVMAEIGHMWAMMRYPDIFKKEIASMRKQLQQVIEHGHDVQLHFHPQWLEAEYVDGKWKQNFTRETTAILTQNYDLALDIVSRGKHDLEELLKPVNPDYACIAYRQGWFSIQPSQNILHALKNAGFLLDSSVVKGLFADTNRVAFDFRNAFSNFQPWNPLLDDVCKEDPDERFFEYPVFTSSTRFPSRIYSWGRKWARNVKLIHELGQGSYEKVSIVVNSKPPRIRSKYYFEVDFTHGHADMLLRCLKKAMKQRVEKTYVPLMFIGHSKSFFLPSQLRRFIRSAKRMRNVEFHTLTEAHLAYRSRNESS